MNANQTSETVSARGRIASISLTPNFSIPCILHLNHPHRKMAAAPCPTLPTPGGKSLPAINRTPDPSPADESRVASLPSAASILLLRCAGPVTGAGRLPPMPLHPSTLPGPTRMRKGGPEADATLGPEHHPHRDHRCRIIAGPWIRPGPWGVSLAQEGKLRRPPEIGLRDLRERSGREEPEVVIGVTDPATLRRPDDQ